MWCHKAKTKWLTTKRVIQTTKLISVQRKDNVFRLQLVVKAYGRQDLIWTLKAKIELEQVEIKGEPIPEYKEMEVR